MLVCHISTNQTLFYNQNYGKREFLRKGVCCVERDSLWKVTSYGAIAKALGTARSRMVGWAMNASHIGMMFQHIA
jgi:alkylated DNA nucleotide flippase Atl1